MFFTLLFRWIFSINSNLLIFKEDIYHLWIPLLIPWIPLLFFLRKRAKIIEFRNGGDAPWVLLIMGWLTITGMLVTSNEYLKTATGKLVNVSSIDDLVGVDAVYVSFDEFSVNGNFGSAYSVSSVSGRGSTNYNMDIYFTYLVNSSDPKNENKFWYGVTYFKGIKNKLSAETKKREYQRFFKYANEHVLSTQFPPAHYYEILPYSDDYENYVESIDLIENIKVESPVILIPKEGKFKDRNGNSLFWFFVFFVAGLIIMICIIGWTAFNQFEYDKQQEKRNN
ncbi:MAG: hypothetical protein HRT58_21065 [Crocinitomicaceae bacterium]|nr:hypothetical protein [Flavobacteriales bacterium]NQZ38163.1 hypothetical protein [Crocinitomicaceae bacterium]